ncbi:MAG TPA: hypothetical protein ENN84_09025 [Candidatus Marinimicrobia bacterium]|nr:hypothetical protein [Candidatus Neomarinimicrobiota bacterium]
MADINQPKENELLHKINDELIKLISTVPESESKLSLQPNEAAKKLAAIASQKAATLAGGLALPPGPWGILTILPDLVGVWKIQSQLVADIAAVYGKSAQLGREAMIYCLFRHSAAQLMRDLLVRASGRVLIRRASLRFIQKLMRSIGIRITQRIIGRTLSRFIPLFGAGAVAAYAWYDTKQVAESAIKLFSQDGSFLSKEEPIDVTDTDCIDT